MKRAHTAQTRRKAGVVTALTAILAIPMMAMLAFCIDLGYIHNVQVECQNVADSASLAGVSQLVTYAPFSSMTDQTLRTTLQNKAVAAAQSEAQKYVQANTAGRVSLTISTSDILVGYWDSSTKTFTKTSVPDSNWPNSVQVTVRRDTTSNGQVQLFFGPFVGMKQVSLTAAATSAYPVSNGQMAGPSVSGLGGTDTTTGTNGIGGLLPFAVDVDSWMYYLIHGMAGPGGTVTDNYSVPTGLGVSTAVNQPDGIPEFQVYPPPSLIHPSQKGLLSFDPSGFSGNGNVITGWINPGPSPSDLTGYFGNNGFQPPQQLYGTPGNKDGHFSDLTGEIRLLPLIDYTKTTTGNQGQYYIVSVVGVRIVYGPDNNAIWAQPAAIPTDQAMSGTSPSSSYTYTDPTTGQTATVPAFGNTVVPQTTGLYSLVK